jgi:hypothetical protein
LELDTFGPLDYVAAIGAAAAEGYDVLIIDSLSHAWVGKGGALEQVDNAAKRERGNTFGAWRNVTPQHNALIDAIIGARLHVIATMRSKTDYVQEKDERTGRTVVRKVGMAPVQRDGMEYEFDLVADLDQDNNMIVSKSRCPSMTGEVVRRAGAEVAEKLVAWLSDGEPETAKPTVAKSKPASIGGVPLGPVSEPEPEPMGYDSDEDDEPEPLPPELAPVGVVESFTELLNACRSESDLKSVAADIKRSVDDADARAALVGVYRARLAEVKVA